MEVSLVVDEVFPYVLPSLFCHPCISLGIPAGCTCHIAHHICICSPIAGGEEVPVNQRIRRRVPVALLIPYVSLPRTALERFVAQPVRPLTVAVLFQERLVIVFGIVDVLHEPVHGFPILIHYGNVVELLPDCPRNDDSGISPSKSHHRGRLCTILSQRSNSWESSFFVLSVPHIPHPFVEEAPCIGKEGSGFGKHLGVGGPSQPLVSLRTVGADGQIVRALSP